MIGALFKKLRKIDLFGRELMFEEHNTQSFKTYIGASLTVAMLITVIILGFIFGQDLYLRKSPTVMISNEIVTESIVKASDFPFLFYLVDVQGYNFQEDINSLFNVEAVYFQVTAGRELHLQRYYGFSKCDPSKYTKNPEFITAALENAKKGSWIPYCIDFKEDYQLKNPYSVPDCQNLAINIFSCQDNYRNTWDYVNKNSTVFPRCSPNRDKILQKFYFRFEFMNSFIDPKNYDNPIIYYPDVFTQQSGKGLSYIIYSKLLNQQLQSDIGWILESYNNTNIISVDPIQVVTTMPSPYEELVTLNLSVANIKSNTIRRYMKVQDLFAKIGGLINAIIIIGNILIYDYVKFQFKISYAYHSAYFDEKNDNEKVIMDALNRQHHHLSFNNKINTNIINYIKPYSHSFFDKSVDKNLIDMQNNNSISNSNILNNYGKSRNIFAEPKINNNISLKDSNDQQNFIINSRINKIQGQAKFENNDGFENYFISHSPNRNPSSTNLKLVENKQAIVDNKIYMTPEVNAKKNRNFNEDESSIVVERKSNVINKKEEKLGIIKEEGNEFVRNNNKNQTAPIIQLPISRISHINLSGNILQNNIKEEEKKMSNENEIPRHHIQINSYLNQSRRDLCEVMSKINVEESQFELKTRYLWLNELKQISYFSFLLTRLCSCCNKDSIKSQAVEHLLSKKSRSTFSLTNYLDTIKKFRNLEKNLVGINLKQ